jgi:hypothetical protein
VTVCYSVNQKIESYYLNVQLILVKFFISLYCFKYYLRYAIYVKYICIQHCYSQNSRISIKSSARAGSLNVISLQGIIIPDIIVEYSDLYVDVIKPKWEYNLKYINICVIYVLLIFPFRALISTTWSLHSE